MGEAGVHVQDAVKGTELTKLWVVGQERLPGGELTPNLDLGVGISQVRKEKRRYFKQRTRMQRGQSSLQEQRIWGRVQKFCSIAETLFYPKKCDRPWATRSESLDWAQGSCRLHKKNFIRSCKVNARFHQNIRITRASFSSGSGNTMTWQYFGGCLPCHQLWHS